MLDKKLNEIEAKFGKKVDNMNSMISANKIGIMQEIKSSITRFEYKFTDYQKKEMESMSSQLKENNQFCLSVQNNYEQHLESHASKYKFLETKVALVLNHQTQII